MVDQQTEWWRALKSDKCHFEVAETVTDYPCVDCDGTGYIEVSTECERCNLSGEERICYFYHHIHGYWKLTTKNSGPLTYTLHGKKDLTFEFSFWRADENLVHYCLFARHDYVGTEHIDSAHFYRAAFRKYREIFDENGTYVLTIESEGRKERWRMFLEGYTITKFEFIERVQKQKNAKFIENSELATS